MTMSRQEVATTFVRILLAVVVGFFLASALDASHKTWRMCVLSRMDGMIHHGGGGGCRYYRVRH